MKRLSLSLPMIARSAPPKREPKLIWPPQSPPSHPAERRGSVLGYCQSSSCLTRRFRPGQPHAIWGFGPNPGVSALSSRSGFCGRPVEIAGRVERCQQTIQNYSWTLSWPRVATLSFSILPVKCHLPASPGRRCIILWGLSNLDTRLGISKMAEPILSTRE